LTEIFNWLMLGFLKLTYGLESTLIY